MDFPPPLSFSFTATYRDELKITATTKICAHFIRIALFRVIYCNIQTKIFFPAIVVVLERSFQH